MIGLVLWLAAAPLPAGSVVLGLSTVDGARTELVALTPRGERAHLGELEHAAGHLPRGLLLGERLVLVSAVADEARGVLEEVKLEGGARRVLARDVLAAVPPALDAAGDVLFVRQASEERFEVVRARDGAVRARVEAAWLHPARGRPAAFLVVERAGGARLAEVVAGELRTLHDLGQRSARSPAFAAGRALVEVALDAQRARILEVSSGKLVREGLAGMDPRPLDARTLAYGAGTKAAGIVVEGERGARLLTAPRSGVAHPLGGAVDDGSAMVVAWLDRGVSLPGELWLFTDAGARRLLEPASGVAVEVYGVVAP